MTAKAKKTGLTADLPDFSPDELFREAISKEFKADTGKLCPAELVDDLIRRASLVKLKTDLSGHLAMTKEEAGKEHSALLGALKKVEELTRRDTLSDSLEASICGHKLTSIASGMGRSMGPNHRMPDEGPSLYDIPDLLAPYIRLVASYKPKAIKPRLDAADVLIATAIEWAESNGMVVSSYYNDADKRQSNFLNILVLLGDSIGIRKQASTWREKLQAIRRKSPP